MRFPPVVPCYCSVWVSLVNSVGILVFVCSKLMMFINFILGPGNVHFDYGQDVCFVKPSREYPSESSMARDAERRLVIFH